MLRHLLLVILGEEDVAFQRCCIAAVLVLLVMMTPDSGVLCASPPPGVALHPWCSVQKVAFCPVVEWLPGPNYFMHGCQKPLRRSLAGCWAMKEKASAEGHGFFLAHRLKVSLPLG